MNVIESALSDALGHGKQLSGLAGKLRDKLKAGVADMQAVYDEAEAFVDASVAKAKEGLASFKDKVAEIEGDVKGEEASASGSIDNFVQSIGFNPNAPAKPAEPALAPEAPVTPPEPEAAAGEAPAAPAPTSSEAPSGAVVTVDPVVGATTHEALSGVVTTVPHDGSEPSAVNTLTGQAAEVEPEAVSEAKDAAKAAGVEVAEQAAAAEPAPVAI